MEEKHENADDKDVEKMLTSTDNEVHASYTVIKNIVDMLEKERNKPIKKKLRSLKDCENQRLRIPLISLYFSQRDKTKLPFEASLLRSLCRLPRQMTRAPFLFGHGNTLERIDEDPLEEPYNEEDNINYTSSDEGAAIDSKTTIKKEAEFGHSHLSRMKILLEKCEIMHSIPEGSRLDEHDVSTALGKSLIKIIPCDKEWLEGIPEARRFHEMAEEESDEDEDPTQARIWL